MGQDKEPRERDYTTGSLHRNIWLLALPMMFETGILNLPQGLDLFWVGRLGSAALAAVTISINVRWVVNSLSNGLGIGGLAVVARRIGEKDHDAAAHATWQTILLGIFMALGLSILGLFIARPLLTLLGADAEVLPLGMAYLRVAFGGLFTLILIFVINSLLRGAGEAGLAMAVLFLAAGTTTVLQPLLVLGWGPIPGLGVAGSAWANVLGFGAGVVLQMTALLRGRRRIWINPRNLKPDWPLMGQIIRIALPSTVQMTLRASSRLIIVGLVGAYGTFATAGYGVASRLMLLVLIPAFGLGNAAGTLVGQNLGARKPGRAERSAWWVSAYTMVYLTIGGALLFVLARPLIAFFDSTPQVVEIGVACMRIVIPSLVPGAAGIVLARGFDGAGNTVPAMAINLLSLWAMELPLAFGLAQWLGWGITGVWWGRALANLANGVMFAGWFRRGRWKEREV